MEPTRKNDAGKPRFSLMPLDCVEEVLRVLTFGAAEYGAQNWRSDIGTSRHYATRNRFIDAAFRHFCAAAPEPISDNVQDEGFDKDSGLHHLAHAIVNLMFVHTYDIHNPNTGMKKHERTIR